DGTKCGSRIPCSRATRFIRGVRCSTRASRSRGRRWHRSGEDDRREPERHAGHRIQADVHGLEEGTRSGAAHVKLAASSMLPASLYFATCGYGQSGRVRTTFPSTMRDAMMVEGAVPFSTHSTSGVNASNVLGPKP